MNSTKKLRIFLFSLLAIVGAASITLAATSQNISGFAWSSNIGWIKLNNCTDTNTCEPGDYGLMAVPAVSGTTPISGYAWSPNIGWVRFDDPNCPTAGCSDGARVNWTTGKIVGWARACSVYTASCSGALEDNIYRGGWDGYIALDSTSGGGSGYGVSFDKTTGAISGYAWGSEVLGWIQFDGKIKIEPTKICPNGTTVLQSADCTCAGGQIYQISTNSCDCPTGTTLQGGQCAVPPMCTGGRLVGNQCVCPVGTNINRAGNACIPIVCGNGMVLQGSICVPVVCGVRQMIDPADPTSKTCICTDGSTIPTTGPNTGICPKKTPKYIES